MRSVIVILVLSARLAAADDDTRNPALAATIPIGLIAGGGALIAVGQALHEHGGGLDAQNVLSGIGGAVIVLAPTTGRLYAGHPWGTGLAMRLVGVGVAAIGGAIAVANSSGDEPSTAFSVGAGIAGLGAAAFAAGAVVEIATAPRAACQYNHEHGANVGLLPLHTADGASGLALVGSF